MSWYDYIPGVNLVHDVATGNWNNAGWDLVGGPIAHSIYDKYKGAVDEQKQGLINASQQSAALANQLKQQDIGPGGGLQKAESYFAPAQAAMKAAYGSPGSVTGGPAQYPVQPKGFYP